MIPKVSIIVPIYNVEKQLKRCIDSILHQTLKDIEVILVDDGSPDNCGNICDEYEKKDDRIKVIHKTNGGLSSARNAGVKIATGEYIGFVDSDDWIEKEMYEKLYSAVSSANSDIGKCGYNILCDGVLIGTAIPEFPQGSYEKTEIMDTLFPCSISQEYIFSTKSRDLTVTAWSHIYNRKFYVNNNLTFVSEKEILSEDHVFTFQAYLKAMRISVLEDKLYNYDLRIGSLSNRYRTNLYERKLNFYNCFYKELKRNKLMDKYKARLDNQYIYNLFECLINECSEVNKTKLSYKIKSMKIILEDKHLKELLLNYPIKNMNFKGKITIFLMKHKCSKLLFSSYKMQKILKSYMNKN